MKTAEVISWDKANTSQGSYLSFWTSIKSGSLTTLNLVLTSIKASPPSGNNLHLLLSFKTSKVSGSSQSPQKYLLHLKHSTFKPLSSHSFLKQDFSLHLFLNLAPLITFTNINFFSGLSIVSKHDVSIIWQESWWKFT